MRAFLGGRRALAAMILVLVAVVATESVVLAVTVRQGTVQYMTVATETAVASTASTAWSDVPSTQLRITVPSGEHDFLQITFSAGPLACYRMAPEAKGAACYVRAAVDGQPVSPGPVAFGDSSSSTQDLTHSMQWVSGVLAPGTHYVKMQFSTGANLNTMSLNTRTLTVVRARAY